MVRSDRSGGVGRLVGLFTKQVCPGASRLFRRLQERDAMAMSRLGTMAREAREARAHVALIRAETARRI